MNDRAVTEPLRPSATFTTTLADSAARAWAECETLDLPYPDEGLLGYSAKDAEAHLRANWRRLAGV